MNAKLAQGVHEAILWMTDHLMEHPELRMILEHLRTGEKMERLDPKDCRTAVTDFLRGPKIDPDTGRITSAGPWQGMTPEEVLAERDAYNRACGE